jgi:hypothetical protein
MKKRQLRAMQALFDLYDAVGDQMSAADLREVINASVKEGRGGLALCLGLAVLALGSEGVGIVLEMIGKTIRDQED